jgi:hypothetical protein
LPSGNPTRNKEINIAVEYLELKSMELYRKGDNFKINHRKICCENKE